MKLSYSELMSAEWKPYCLMCRSMDRMERTEYGYKCKSCHNEINKDLTHQRGMAMIKAHYTSNLDSCKRVLCVFPEELVAVPQIGSRIRATKSVYVTNNAGESRDIPELTLYVVGIVYGSHKRNRSFQCDHPDCVDGDCEYSQVSWEPYVEIELHHPHAKEMGLL